jgi:hypothetical protein
MMPELPVLLNWAAKLSHVRETSYPARVRIGFIESREKGKHPLSSVINASAIHADRRGKSETMQSFDIVQTNPCFHGKLDLVVATKLANAAY